MNIEVSMPYKSNRFDQAKFALAKEGQASIGLAFSLELTK